MQGTSTLNCGYDRFATRTGKWLAGPSHGSSPTLMRSCRSIGKRESTPRGAKRAQCPTMDGELARGWRIEAAGDRCLIVELGTRVDPQINRRVHALASRLIAARIEGVSDVVPAFTTVAVHYRPEKLPGSASGESPHARLEKTVEALLASGADAFAAEARTVEIPVCYGGDFGPDLDEVASACSLSAGRVIELHGASPHLVYMLGFAPGFPYMGGLDPRLAMPRRSTPRLKIAAGTVAIAREQSAIYTLQTPGGWNLIGRTPLTFFRPDADPPSLLRPGDRVRFVAVSRERYDEIAERVRADLERAPGDSR